MCNPLFAVPFVGGYLGLAKMQDDNRKANNAKRAELAASSKIPVSISEQSKMPTYADASVQKAGEEQRRIASALGGYSIKTSPQGLTGMPVTEKKKLLGQ